MYLGNSGSPHMTGDQTVIGTLSDRVSDGRIPKQSRCHLRLEMFREGSPDIFQQVELDNVGSFPSTQAVIRSIVLDDHIPIAGSSQGYYVIENENELSRYLDNLDQRISISWDGSSPFFGQSNPGRMRLSRGLRSTLRSISADYHLRVQSV